MRFCESTFLYGIKNLVTGLNGDSVPTVPQGASSPSTTAESNDGGIKVDIPIPLSGFVNLGTGVAITLAETSMSVLQVPSGGSLQSIGHISLMIPRDYDEASDHFKIRLLAQLVNADAGITQTATVYIKQVGAAAAQAAISPVAGKAPFALTGAAALPLSQTEQVLEFTINGQGLLRDAVIDVAILQAGTTTGATNIYGVEYTYDSTIVSYNDTTATDDVGNASGIAGTLTGYGQPLR